MRSENDAQEPKENNASILKLLRDQMDCGMIQYVNKGMTPWKYCIAIRLDCGAICESLKDATHD